MNWPLQVLRLKIRLTAHIGALNREQSDLVKNTDGARKGRPGAVRQGSKGRQVGSGGQGRQALEGRKPTPKAEDRPFHPAGKRKAAAERYEAAGGKPKDAGSRQARSPGAARLPKSAGR